MKLLTLLTTIALSLSSTLPSVAQSLSTVLHLGKVPGNLEFITVDYDGFSSNDLGYVRYQCPVNSQIPAVRTLAHQYYKVSNGKFPDSQPPKVFYDTATVIRQMCLSKVKGILNDRN